jgi:DNA-binding Lrp family transcriptional regulator
MIIAYVFIHISAPDPLEVLHALRQIPAVQQAHLVLGPTDCISLIECADHEALQELIPVIRVVRGVLNTETRYIYA